MGRGSADPTPYIRSTPGSHAVCSGGRQFGSYSVVLYYGNRRREYGDGFLTAALLVSLEITIAPHIVHTVGTECSPGRSIHRACLPFRSFRSSGRHTLGRMGSAPGRPEVGGERAPFEV